ncbi:MAG TPA: sulfotransferase, partial [Steroidobacteraceae bacterium]|nr:sulfotransferase [Steroidobacteraceae bacterium]
ADWERYATAGDPVIANIGQLLLLLGELARAEQATQLAAAGPGSTLESRLKLVQLFERTNRLAEARAQLDQLLADPRSAQLGADLLLTQAHMAQREGQHSLASQLFRKKLAACKELHDEHSDLYPLAKSLDALGQYEEAFDTLLRAHRSQRAYLKRSAPLAVLRGAPMMVIAERGCDPADVLKWDERDGPAAAESPIFIVAFPRSGTTLLELALDAHPLLKSMDEQPFLQNALDDLSATGARYPTQLGRLSRAELDGVRSRYWERVRSKIKLAPGQRLVDKNPLNLLRLPVIKRLFPHTQVLVAIRHPCDVLLSCFMQHFRAPEFALLCQSLPMLAAGYRKAFEFWYEQQSILRAQVLELRYETFVADFETWIRAAVAFLELPWNDAVLAPGKRAQDKRYISTPSYSQVVQPISGKAVGRWQNYRHHFSQVLPVVQPLLDRWHYDA